MALDYTWEVREGLIRKEARTEGSMEATIDSIENIQKNLGLDLQQACAAIGISVEEYEEMKKVLADN